MSTEQTLAADPPAPSAAGGPPRTREALRAWVDREVAPFAGEWDRAEAISPEIVRRMAELGFLGAVVPREWGGEGMDMVTFARVNEELGRGCSSVRSLVTVHSMASFAIARWGGKALRERWLRPMAAGDAIGAFALTEPEVGSDAASIAAEAVPDGDHFVVTGTKRWITFGLLADVYLVIARSEGQPLALLVERGTPGLTVTPIRGVTGTRGAMLAELRFEGCRVPAANRVGGAGFGMAVALTSLEIGRLSVAAGSVGIIQASLEAALRYASERQQFGAPLSKHQLIRRMLTDMAAEVRAARLLCESAGRLYDAGDPAAREEIFIAKYFASTACARAARDALQIHGANGCTDAYPVDRLNRDAHVMEVIEGSTQIMQITIARQELQAYGLLPS
jgi:glutaryl-CoA dehydrogenase (non-decarboxylating)